MRKVQDKIKAVVNENNSPHTRMTLLASLKDSLGGYDLEKEQKKDEPAKKLTRFQAGRKETSLLLYMTPQTKKIETDDGPRTMLGSAPKSKYPFAIAYKLPFIAFPIGDGRTSKDVATLSGLLDTGGCCNMGNLMYHQAIIEQFPQFVDKMTCLEEKRFEKIKIGGMTDGVTIMHIVRYAIPFKMIKGSNAT